MNSEARSLKAVEILSGSLDTLVSRTQPPGHVEGHTDRAHVGNLVETPAQLAPVGPHPPPDR